MTRSFVVLVAVLFVAAALMAACGSEPEDRPEVAADPGTLDVPTPVPPTIAATAQPSSPLPPVTPTALVGEQLRTRHDYGPEQDQFGWLQLPAAPAPDNGFPVVILVHGGFWRQQFGATLMDDLATDLAERGYASWNIEYRRVGGAGGWSWSGYWGRRGEDPWMGLA